MNKKIFILLLIIASLGACRNKQSAELDRGHDHDEVKILITTYSEDFEIFAEADPFVQGKASNILAHFTHLEDFKPLTEASITMSLVVGTKGIRQTVDTPLKEGIYSFRLQPETTGMGRIFFDISLNDSIYRIEGGRFMVFADEHSAIHAAEESALEHPAAISFTKEQSWLVDFETTTAKSRSLGVVIKTVGEIIPARDEEITLSAKTQGIVRFINNTLYEGIRLHNGEVLMNISGEGLAEGNASQRYQEARNNFQRARADYERLSSLAESRIVSQAELLEAENEYQNARAVFENLSRNFSESGQQVKSPKQGFLTNLFVSNGEFVEAGQALASVSSNNNLVIKTQIQQRYAPMLPNIKTANLITNEGDVYSLDSLNGSILSYARSINNESHLLPVYLQLEQNPGWIAGSLLDVFLKTSGTEEQITVPVTALVEEQGNYFVFVQIHPESFEKREVKTGQSDGEYIEILRGLSANERIISRGALLVKMAAASGAIDPHSGHVH